MPFDLTPNQVGKWASLRHSKALGFDARFSPKLKAWMLRYAQYIASDPRPRGPTRTERRVFIQNNTGQSITNMNVKALEAREDFQAYLAQIEEGPIAEAKARYEGDYPFYVDALKTATQKSLANEDYRQVTEAAKMAIQRIAPVADEKVQATQVTINLSAKQLEGIDAQAIVVEATPVE